MTNLQLQKNLNKLGATPKLAEDGKIGPASKRAIRDFQKKYGLDVDGIAGIKTRSKITELIGVKPKQRNIKYIVVHSTGEVQTQSIQSIKNHWRNKLGWVNPGYHYIIEANGNTVQLFPLEGISNGVAGYNSVSVHVCYIGGKYGIDNRTDAQKKSLLIILKELRQKFPKAVIQGHRDFPGVKKYCPSFDAKKEYKDI